MFVAVSVLLAAQTPLVVLPQTAVVHAPYGDSVFVIEPKPAGSPGATRTPDGKPIQIARQQFVELGRIQGDFVAVSRGVTAGQLVVSFGAFKLRNGAPIVVDNTVAPAAELHPRPENR
jgi:membrane fusion protein (multidrug efflux system)